MAVDVIRQVGPGGHFLTQMHTKANFQEEIWQAKYVNRDSPDPWAKKGGPSYEQVVTQKARDILQTYRPEPLPEDVSRRLAKIAGEAADSLANVQFIS
jgi:trimethylamine--corrinoid protein Co-methyltransferase